MTSYVCLAIPIYIYIDHVAVDLFLNKSCAALTVFSPCAWEPLPGRFKDSGVADWRTNPGRSANKYHAEFSQKTRKQSLGELERARQKGASIDCSIKGFHARNSAIAAASDYLVAFTWSDGAEPDGGGTLDTWKKCHISPSRKFHVPLAFL